MEFGLLSILGIGFLIGLRHTFDPDHIVAVSTIASRTGNVFKASFAGVFWGIGHSLTLFIVGLLLVAMKATVPELLALSLEMIVGMMLIILGWTTFQSFKRKKIDLGHSNHIRPHTKINKPNIKSLVVGMIHGLAGSGALVLLTLSSMNTMAEAALYILIFGIGTILGMIIFATLIGLPFVVLSKYAAKVERILGMAAGIFSIGFGFFFMYEVAFVEGLFFRI